MFRRPRISVINYENKQILQIFLGVGIFFLLSIAIIDITIVSLSKDQCLKANFSCGIGQGSCSPFGVFYLGSWLLTDGFIKIAVFTAVLFFNCLNAEVKCGDRIVILCGNLIRIFYIFDLGWTIYASVLFWGSNGGFEMPTYKACGAVIQGYLFFLLIFSYVIIPINIYIAGFRSTKSSLLPSQPTIGDISLN